MKPLIFIFLFFFSCSKQASIVSIYGTTMGTTYSVKYVGRDKAFKQNIDVLLENINDSMSTYRPHSELSRINKNGSKGWIPLSSELSYVLNNALELSRISDGAYDVTLGPLVNLWGFGPNGKRRVPTQNEIIKAKERVGFKKLQFKKGRVRKLHSNLYIDLSSIAKGYGVDVIAKFLEEKGVDNYLVEIGGELRSEGSKPSGSWRVAIQTPGADSSAINYVLNLSGQSVATSGDYRNFFTAKNRRYSHTIDGKSGKPVQNNVASVTVVSEKSCMLADGQATMLLAMGKEKAISLAENLKLAVYLIWRNGKQFTVYKSPRFKELFND